MKEAEEAAEVVAEEAEDLYERGKDKVKGKDKDLEKGKEKIEKEAKAGIRKLRVGSLANSVPPKPDSVPNSVVLKPSRNWKNKSRRCKVTKSVLPKPASV